MQLSATFSNDAMYGPSINIYPEGRGGVVEELRPSYDATVLEALTEAGYRLRSGYEHLRFRLHTTMREVSSDTVPVEKIS